MLEYIGIFFSLLFGLFVGLFFGLMISKQFVKRQDNPKHKAITKDIVKEEIQPEPVRKRPSVPNEANEMSAPLNERLKHNEDSLDEFVCDTSGVNYEDYLKQAQKAENDAYKFMQEQK